MKKIKISLRTLTGRSSGPSSALMQIQKRGIKQRKQQRRKSRDWFWNKFCHQSNRIFSMHTSNVRRSLKLGECDSISNLEGKKTLAERGFDPRTSGLWAQHASTAPLCYLQQDSAGGWFWASDYQMMQKPKKDCCQKWDSNPRPQKWTATWTQRLRPLGHPDFHDVGLKLWSFEHWCRTCDFLFCWPTCFSRLSPRAV